MKKIRFGIVGYGKMGKIREKIIASSKNSKLIGIFDSNRISLKDKSIKVCKSFNELINLDIDAVIICTFANSLAKYTIYALQSGKHVFCEKPPAMNIKEMRNVMKAEKKCKKILKYGFNHRFHNSIMKAKEIIESKKLGKIIIMRGVYGKAGSIDFDKNWRQYKKFSGGGILFDQGIHMLDLFRFFSKEEFHCVGSYSTKLFWNIEFEDNVFAILKSNKNTVCTINSSATQWKHKFNLEIILEKGYIILDGLLTPTGSYAPEKIITGSNYYNQKKIFKEKIITYRNDKSWNLELKEFTDAIKNNNFVKNGNSKDAYNTIELLESIYTKSV